MPDFALYNANEPVASTFESSLAIVQSSGAVFWSRPGTISALCRYSGVVNFPGEELSCAIELGGWALSGAYQGLRNVSVSLSGLQAERTAAPSYAAFNLTGADAHITSYTYPSSPMEPYPVMMVNFQLRRSNGFSWWLLYMLPTIVLTYLACFSACLPPETGN